MQSWIDRQNRLKVGKAIDRLSAGWERSPTPGDIAAATRLDVEDVIEALVVEDARNLDPRAQIVLEMRLLEHRTQAEIAERLDMPQLHVSRLLRQALDHPDRSALAAPAA